MARLCEGRAMSFLRLACAVAQRPSCEQIELRAWYLARHLSVTGCCGILLLLLASHSFGSVVLVGSKNLPALALRSNFLSEWADFLIPGLGFI